MIDPPPASFIGPSTALMPSMAPVRLTARTRFHLSTSSDFSGATWTMPALFTRTLTFPNAVTAASTAACHCSSSLTSRCT